jgi:hypothetical protein
VPTPAQHQAAKKANLRLGYVCADRTRETPSHPKKSRLGFTTNFRCRSPGPTRRKTANHIRKCASFTTKSWWTDHQSQGGTVEASQGSVDKFVKDYEKKHGALHPSVSVSFDPNLQAAGATNFGGSVTIGKSAFSSAANLRSTLVHELGAHVEQIRSGNFGTSREGDLVNEIEAYRLEESSRRETGLKGSDLKDVRSEISTRLDELKKVSPEYYGRVQAGNYRLNPRDACSPSTCNLGAF